MPRLTTKRLFSLTHIYEKSSKLGPPVTNTDLLARKFKQIENILGIEQLDVIGHLHFR